MEQMPGWSSCTTAPGKERKLSRFHLYFGTVYWCVSVLVPFAAAFQPEEMFLNSLANCGHGDSKAPWHKVDQFSLYSIKDDVSPHTRTGSFLQNCEMVFRSTRSDGRLCVFQRNLQFKNNKVELRLYDGHLDVDGKTTPDKVVNMDSDLYGVEWCTSGRFLTIEMVPRGMKPSVKEVVIDLLVYQMNSIHRKAYLDTSPSCGSTLEMDHSKVNVTNLDLSLNTSYTHWMCSLYFEYKGHEENRSLCIVFEPSPRHHAPCTFNYTLQVHEFKVVGGSLQEELSKEGSCLKPLPERMCFNSSKISLTLERHSRNSGNRFEKDTLFYALVLDHHGGPESLPSLFPDTPEKPLPSESTIILAACITGTMLLIIVLTVIAVLVWRRQKAKQPQKKVNGDAHERMLSVTEHRANGQNLKPNERHCDAV